MNEFNNFNSTGYEEYTDFTVEPLSIEEEATELYEASMYYAMRDILEYIYDVNADALNELIASLSLGDMLEILRQYDMHKTNPVIREELVKILDNKIIRYTIPAPNNEKL